MSAPVDVLGTLEACAALAGYRLNKKRQLVIRAVAAGRAVHPEDACKADRAEYLREQAIASRAAVAELIKAATKRVRECQMCGGHGLIDTSSGQTPDTYQPDAMDCPECSELGHALARVQGGEA